MGVHQWPGQGPPRGPAAPERPVWVPVGLLVQRQGVPFVPLGSNHCLPVRFPPGMLAEAANSA